MQTSIDDGRIKASVSVVSSLQIFLPTTRSVLVFEEPPIVVIMAMTITDIDLSDKLGSRDFNCTSLIALMM